MTLLLGATTLFLFLAGPAVACAQVTAMPPPSIDRAWSMLTSSVAPVHSSHDRIEALAALGSMGVDPRAEKLIGDAMRNGDMDVRTAAILAADHTKNPQLIDELRAALDDKEPQIAYAAATTLWRMHDSSGEDLLLAVVSGDRPAKPGMIKREKHIAAKDLHSPATLTTLGIEHGAGFFLGPFGFGAKAIEFIHKNGGNAERAAAVDLLAEEHTETVHEALIDAVDDKDFAVRAAAARALGDWPGNRTAELLRHHFDDERSAVSLTAAAAYIASTSHTPHPNLKRRRRPRTSFARFRLVPNRHSTSELRNLLQLPLRRPTSRPQAQQHLYPRPNEPFVATIILIRTYSWLSRARR